MEDVERSGDFNFTDGSEFARHDQDHEQEQYDNHQEDHMEYEDGRSLNKSQSRIKLGGKVEPKGYDRQQLRNNFTGHSFCAQIDNEKQQFEHMNNHLKGDAVQKYVELISTGNFVKVKKFPVAVHAEDFTNEAAAFNRMQFTQELLAVQKKWFNRVNQLYKLLLGILAGMMLLMAIMLTPLDAKTALEIYTPYAVSFGVTFQLLSSIALICCMSLTHMYSQNVNTLQEGSSGKHISRDAKERVKRDYCISVVMTIILMVPWFIFYAVPIFINNMICDKQAITLGQLDLKCTTDSTANYVIFRSMIYLASLCYVIGWFTQSGYAKAEVEGIELKPDEMVDSCDSDSEESHCSGSDHDHSDNE